MPVQPPRGWGAEQWAKLRQSCLRMAEKIQEHEPLTFDELGSREMCMGWGAPPPPSATGQLLPPPPPPLRVPPVSQPTPVPETPPQSSIGGAAITTASAVDPVIGPFGTPFPGGGGDACTGSPPVQPPDVAADVSPAENAELLNQGLWVFDKQGTVSAQTPLNVFWCPSGSTNPLPGCGTNRLTDTQVAFDQIAQRWLVTTLSVAPDSTGNLYFAVSDTSSAAGTWTLYAYPNVCSFPAGATTPDPDQPDLGYNANWIVIDVLCGNAGTGGFGEDNILTVPHDSITGSTLPPSLTWGIQQSNFFAERPSRDIGAASAPDSYPDVFLVSSQVPSGSYPYVIVQEIGPSTSNPPPITGPGSRGGTVQSPGVGVAGGYAVTPIAQPGCSPSSNCAITVPDGARIKSVILQEGNDGNHYLMTSFMAEDQADQTAQSLYFLGEVETFASQPQWNEWWVGGWSQSNAWGTYPTVTMDKDLDIAWTFETFGPNNNPYPNWYIAKGFAPPGASYVSPPLLGDGIEGSASSGGAFTGQTSCNGSNPQPRWGDYVSTVWDPDFSSPSGETGAFWTVQEYTTGGSDQSTNGGVDPVWWSVLGKGAKGGRRCRKHTHHIRPSIGGG